MRRSLFSVVFGTVLCFGALTCAAQALSDRTWVTGLGDDANPCSRTAPCRTFAGALLKTNARGEIDALDPGGFDAVTITKAITIDGGGMGAVTVRSGSAITVSAGRNDAVLLRRLNIEGSGTAANGIEFGKGQSLGVEQCVIHDFTNAALLQSTSQTVPAFLTVLDSSFNANGYGLVTKAGEAPVRMALKNSSFTNNGMSGIFVNSSATVQIKNVLVAGNGYSGSVYPIQAGQSAELNIDDSIVSNNNNGGLFAIDGGLMRVSNTTVTDNDGTGISVKAGSQIWTYGNNRVQGNMTKGTLTNGTFSGPVPLS